MFDFDWDAPGALIYNEFLNTLWGLELINAQYYYEHEAYVDTYSLDIGDYEDHH